MDDIYVYYGCVDGHCPKIIEEEIYGNSHSCDVYCGNEFTSCESCFFLYSDLCKNCIHFQKQD